MKYSFLTSVYRRYSMEKAFEDGARFGYQGIELWGGRPHAYPFDMDDKRIERVHRMARNTGLEISVYTPEVCVYPYNLCSQEEKERRETIEYFKLSLDIAKEIGAPLIQITPGDPGYGSDYQKDWARLVEGCREIAEHAESVGVGIVMEALTPYESLILTTTNDLLRLLGEVPSEYFRSMLDCVSPLVVHEPMSDYFIKLKNKMGHLHLADGDGISYSHLLVGDGEFNFDGLFRLVNRYGYKGYGSIELDDRYCNDPETYIEQSITRLKRIQSRVE
ncbi:MAG TPA: TIM barrel protein [Clostridia bacterium]|nr:TIM barrel protein [Clostridia bacterium]